MKPMKKKKERRLCPILSVDKPCFSLRIVEVFNTRGSDKIRYAFNMRPYWPGIKPNDRL
jgi:hypothetical protein